MRRKKVVNELIENAFTKCSEIERRNRLTEINNNLKYINTSPHRDELWEQRMLLHRERALIFDAQNRESKNK